MSRDDLQEVAHPTEAEAVQLVRAALYLLLEIGQRVSMQQILDATWSADLLTSTGHLIRGEVHPDLRPLVLPAKMLQNTLAPLARAAAS